MKSTFCSIFAVITLLCGVSHANLISEFRPNPPGGDPPLAEFELSGIAGGSLDFWILSIENDGFNGLVDRASQHSGTYDANGLLVVNDVPDLENPSFTVILTDNFTGTAGSTDIDPANDGVLDLSSIGTIFDNVGVSDQTADDASLYSTILGGNSILWNGVAEPELAFRDASTGDFYQVVFSGQVFTEGAVEVNPLDFNADPVASTFGAINPSISAVPEPSSMVVLAMMGTVMLGRRRRKN